MYFHPHCAVMPIDIFYWSCQCLNRKKTTILRRWSFILLSLLLSYYHHSLIIYTWNYSYNGRASTPDCWKVDPLGAFTPECDRALQEAQAARERGLHLRQETADLIDKCDKLKKSVAKSVNDGITQKMGETTSLKVRVIVSVDHMTLPLSVLSIKQMIPIGDLQT